MCVSEVLQCYRYVALGSVASVSVNCVLNVFVFVSNVPVYGWAVCRMPATPVSEANQACDCWQGGGYLCEEFTQQMFGRKPWHKSCWSRIWIEILSNWHWTQSKKQQSRVFWTIANKFQTNCEHKSNQLRAQLWAMHETALLLSTISPFPNNLLWGAVKIPPRR